MSSNLLSYVLLNLINNDKVKFESELFDFFSFVIITTVKIIISSKIIISIVIRIFPYFLIKSKNNILFLKI